MEMLKEQITLEELIEMVCDINGYNGYFEDLDYWENDEEFFEVMFPNKMEIVRATYYGDYHFMDDWVKFDVYGNLKSVNQWEYEKEVESQREEIIEHYLQLYTDNHCEPSSELEKKIKNYLEAEND